MTGNRVHLINSKTEAAIDIKTIILSIFDKTRQVYP